MNKQDITQKYVEFQVLNQQIQQSQQQLQLMSQQVQELRALSQNVEEISKSKANSEMYTNLGVGVHLKSKVEEIKHLLVNVGAGILVKKTPQETSTIVNKQVTELDKFCINLNQQVQQQVKRAEELREEISKAQEKK